LGLGLVLVHVPLLHLPYYWDEAGYYIPAARDLLLSGSLIPQSTVSNAHPPLVMAYLALLWKIAGFKPVVTRIAMLGMAVFSLVGFFRLAAKAANCQVAWASTLCVAVYPVFFAQSSLAHVDLAAAGLSFWAWSDRVDGRPWRAAAWFSLAALAKETAVLIPLALLAWELLGRLPSLRGSTLFRKPRRRGSLVVLLVPVVPLAMWFAFHYWRTGYIFGNPEFFRYNVQATLQPLRILLALVLRLWQLLGYSNLLVLTGAALVAMWWPPQRDEKSDEHRERPRIALDTQFEFYAVIAVYTLAMSLIGGAVLARYMLPVVPLVILVCVSTIWRRVRPWRLVLGIVVAGFLVALFINPHYGFAMEDNLAYRDYIVLHQHAEVFLEERYPQARVLTAWPASDEITRPYLGYVNRPLRVFQIEDFTVEHLMVASELTSKFDVAFVFSTKYDHPHPWFRNWQAWQEWKARFFGYHRDLPPAVAAQVLGGRLVYEEECRGQWAAVIEIEQIQEATANPNVGLIRSPLGGRNASSR
jgi:4-amino-4-deoxy-L-arabinose transferase-like glycosyltransferase